MTKNETVWPVPPERDLFRRAIYGLSRFGMALSFDVLLQSSFPVVSDSTPRGVSEHLFQSAECIVSDEIGKPCRFAQPR